MSNASFGLVIVMLAITFGGWGYLFARWQAKRRLARVGQGVVAASAPMPIHKGFKRSFKIPRWLRICLWTFGLIAGGFGGLCMIPNADAALSDTMRSIFTTELSAYVKGIMSNSENEIHVWGKLLLSFGFLIVVVTELTVFIFEGFEPLRIIEATIMVCGTLILWANYDYATEAVWGVGLGISDGLQKALVGNTDNFFMSQFIRKAMSAVTTEEIGFFDTMKSVYYLASWTVVAFFLDFAAWLSAIWADYGYALAKIVGTCFVPFLMIKGTRGLFDSWFRFLLGFIILKVILTATMVIAVIALKSILADLGVRFEGGYTGNPGSVHLSLDKFYLLFDASAMMLVSILFVLSSFVFAAALASGAGNLGGSLSSAASTASRLILKKIA